MDPFRLLSLGAGVQSSALLLLAADGELEADAAVFADTGVEPAAVYAWLDHLETLTDLEIHRVKHSSGMNLADWSTRDDATTDILGLPYHIQRPDGVKGLARRSCTREFKIRPIRRKARELAAGRPVVMMIGISTDEHWRMRDSDVKYITNSYPLIDRRWSRNDALQYVNRRTGETPPRSACTICPYRSNAEWSNLTAAELEAAAAYEDAANERNAANRKSSYDGRLTLHASGPIADARFSDELDGQLDLFGNECEGMCGV